MMAEPSFLDQTGLRRRKQEDSDTQAMSMDKEARADNSKFNKQLDGGTYWLTRIVLLRYICFIYFVAFLVAFNQNGALIGKDGLLPADSYLLNIKRHTGPSLLERMQHVPTLLWFVDFHQDVDFYLNLLAISGLLLSGTVMLLGCANILLMLLIWLIYHSIVNVGQRWYGFGWESQLLESGFLAAFLCPLLTFRCLPRRTPSPLVAVWGFRWLIFRIMLGAGLIKIRGDKCWRDLTCMNYHYETQPVPNPLSYYMHQTPDFFHQIEVMTNHFVELAAPFLLLLPRPFRITGGIIQILFQVVLILSGNLSFLNWLTIVPCLACFDDASLQWMFSKARGGIRWQVIQIQEDEKLRLVPRHTIGQRLRQTCNILLGVLLTYLSLPIIQNLVSSQQIMNTSFDPLRLVNTYGAFGSITKERTEVILQGTYDNPHSPTAKWLEYQFKCKPGNVKRRPCIISPYHYRLDWLMWFAAFQSYQHNPWLVHMAAKLMVNDNDTVDLMAYNPFQDKVPPKYIRAEHYRYKFTKIGSRAAANGAWFKRTRIGNYMPPVSLDSLKDLLRQMGWKQPMLPQTSVPVSAPPA